MALNAKGRDPVVLEDRAFAREDRWNHEQFEWWSIEKMLDFFRPSPAINVIQHAWD